MKTPEDIKTTLRFCAAGDCPDAGECPYEDDCMSGWGQQFCVDTLAYIEQLESKVKESQDRIDLMMIQMRGDCECCKYNGMHDGMCDKCMSGYNLPYWEYKGLPETQNTGGKNNG